MAINFRTPTAQDAANLAELGSSSFVDAFGHLYSPENLSIFLSATYALEVVMAELAHPRRLFRVAEQDGQLIGYCKLGLDYGFDFDMGHRRAMELKQLYLRGAITGKGVGSSLMEWAVTQAKVLDYDDLVLSVYSENFAGQRFYDRHGFRKIAETYFMVGNHRDDEFLYALALRPLAS